ELAKQALLLGVPAALIIVGCMALIVDWRFRWTASKARGRVVGHQERPDDEDRRRSMYQSIVEFSDGERTHQIVDFSSYGWRIDRLESEVWVLFPPGRPEQARISRHWPQIACAALIAAGTVVLYLAITRQ